MRPLRDPSRVRRLAGLALLTAGLTGCNRYMLFNQAGYEQTSFSNDADILFVVDNSASMAQETAALALEFNTFINTLTSAAGSEPVTETLTDAVNNYTTYTQQRGRFLDYQLGIVTTSVDFQRGETDAIDPGEAGLLIGPAIKKGDGGVADAFREQLLCDTAYWAETDVPPDPGYECGSDQQPDFISQEYLDCICGLGEWEETSSGSGQEEPLEATLMALCRAAAANPGAEVPEACYDPLAPFTSSQAAVNEGFLREEGTVVVVMITDEGDDSRRMAQGEIDSVEAYLQPLEEFGKPVKLIGITPALDDATGGVICGADLNPAPPTWSIERIVDATEATGGFHRNIIVQGADACETSDFSQHLTDLGQLLINLVTAFQLQSIPDVTTLRVWVDGEEIMQAAERGEDEITDENPDPYTTGWSYDPSENAVSFWGAAVPDFNADVEIFYRPLESKPRDLPF